jgi:Na+/H+-dicarboxylate symporter
VLVKLVGIIMLAAPIGLGAWFAALVGEFGPQLLGTYARAMAVYYPVAIAYFFVSFTVYAWLANGRRGIAEFWKHIPTPAATALATGSSIGTIPVNLIAAQKIGVPRDIRELVIPIGATIHMDGSCLSAILKITFLFGVFGMERFGLTDMATAVGVALLSGMVMAGIPGGGFIGEMLIVSLYGFPAEALPILAAIGTLVYHPETMLNSSGDTVCSMMTARLVDGKNWQTIDAET